MAGPSSRASKEEWRTWARSVRSGLDFQELSQRVVVGLLAWEGLQGVVLTYHPLADEIDLSPLAESEVELVVTRTPDRGPLTVHPYASPTEWHRYGFLQPLADAPQVDPVEIDVALVPGLAFDRTGIRLGRGSGYFDELLTRLEPGVPRVGIVPSALVVDALPEKPHDVAMTHLATEGGVSVCRTPPPPTALSDLPTASHRVAAAGRDLGLDIAVLLFPEGTKTSQEAADAIGCPVSAIVKSLVFVVDGQPVIALLPGDVRLDPAKLAEVHGGAEARRASLDEVRAATGYVAGGTPPFGHTRPLVLYADPNLGRHREVWAAAGTPTTVFPIDLDDLIRVTGATWADLAED